ncbi:MAG: glutamate synthase-related protein [Ignisphaera sp.]
MEAKKMIMLSAKNLSPRDVNRALRQIVSEGVEDVEISDPNGIHYLAVGLKGSINIYVRGSVGFYVAALMHGPRVYVEGNAGWFAGENMSSGELVIMGDAGNGTGQYILGGTIVVNGDAGARVGALMKKGTVIVNGKTDIMTGMYMFGGKIIVLGNVGEYVGELMIGGEIYVGGGYESLGKNAIVKEASEEEKEQINNVLSSYGIKGKSSYFKIVPQSRRPVYGHQQYLGVPEPLIPKYKVEILYDICNGCRECVKACPQGVFYAVQKDSEYKVVPRNINKCVGCYACVRACPNKAIHVIPLPDLRRVGFWDTESINYTIQTSVTGIPLVRGTGARNFNLPSLDELLILPAQLSRPPIDSYREPCDTEVVLGFRFAERPLRLKAPIIIGAMSYGSLSKEAKIAIARATSRVGIAVNTGEGGMLPEERAEAKILIAQYASGRFGVTIDYLLNADAIEIKIGQGAKPGQGGLLMGEKVTEEIAQLRGIPVGADAISPARHLDIVGPEDLKMKIDELREATDWKIPIIVKIAAGRVRDDVKIAAKAGADIIVVDAKPAGTGASPNLVTDHVGYPVIAAVVEADRALRELGLRDEVSLVVSGGIRNGADIAKLIALGADAVAVGTPVLVAMGCTMCGLCNTGRCPYGIATQNPALRKRLDVERAAKAVENLLHSMIKELCMFSQLAGKTSPKGLEKEDLRALTLEASLIAGVKLVGLEGVPSKCQEH